MSILKTTLLQNGYAENNIKRALRPRKPKSMRAEGNPIAKAHLPYLKRTTDKIEKVLEIETGFTGHEKINNSLPSAKTEIKHVNS